MDVWVRSEDLDGDTFWWHEQSAEITFSEPSSGGCVSREMTEAEQRSHSWALAQRRGEGDSGLKPRAFSSRGLTLSPARAARSPDSQSGGTRRRSPPKARCASSPSTSPSSAGSLRHGSSPASAALLAEALDRLSNGVGTRSQALDAFRKVDKDSSGELDSTELKLALKLLNLHLSARQTSAIMQHLDKDGNGSVSFDEFLSLVWSNKLKLLQRKLGAAAYSIGGVDTEKLFRQYDKDRSGALEFEEFRLVVRRDVGIVERDVPDEELREMFQFVDSDGGGTIGIDEFKRLLPEEDDGRVRRQRYSSVVGQALNRILESADERRENMMYLFHRFDADGSGGLEREEFRQAMLALEVMLSPCELDALMGEMDSDGDGFVTPKEFSDRLRVAKKDRRVVEGSPMATSPSRHRSPPKARCASSPSTSPSSAGSLRHGSSPASAALLAEALDRLSNGVGTRSQALDAFRKVDKDSSGELDSTELKLALKLLNLHLSARQTSAIMQHLDKDGNGSVSFDEFLSLVWSNKLKLLQRKLGAAAYSIGGVDTEKLFRQYDKDRSGALEFEEFRLVVRRDVGIVERDVPDEELREMFQFVDSDGGGTIGIDEFKRLLPEEDDGRVRRQRYSSVVGQALNRILESADERRENMMYLFHRFDADGSGGLEREEFRQAMLALEVMLSPCELDALMGEMDSDGDGFVTPKEFSDRLRVAKKDRRVVEGSPMATSPSRHGNRPAGGVGSRSRRTSGTRRRTAGHHGLHHASHSSTRPVDLAPEYSRHRAELVREIAGLEKWLAAFEARQASHKLAKVVVGTAALEPEPEPESEPTGAGITGPPLPEVQSTIAVRHSSENVVAAHEEAETDLELKIADLELKIARAQKIQELERWLLEQQLSAPVDVVVGVFDYVGAVPCDQWLPTLQVMTEEDRQAFIETLVPVSRATNHSPRGTRRKPKSQPTLQPTKKDGETMQRLYARRAELVSRIESLKTQQGPKTTATATQKSEAGKMVPAISEVEAEEQDV
eukprot:COSAG02_NODE_243_length_27457_cov_16.852328_8_plen_1013_part_00